MNESPYAVLDIPVWLMSPEHATRMGGALWVFLWLWREGQGQESPYARQVRGGGSFTAEEIGAALGLHERTVRRHLADLVEAGYLTTWRERHGLTAVVNLWRPGEIGQNIPRPDKVVLSEQQSARPDKVVRSETPDRTELSGLDDENAVNFVRSENPPGPPLRVLKRRSLYVDIPEGSSSSPSCGFNVTPTAKTANVVPIKASPPAPSAGAAVVAAQDHHRLRREQAILHHLSRIPEFQRPELNRTLRESLSAVPFSRLADVFELGWLSWRFQGSKVRNPPAWWMETLRRTAQECIKAVAEDEAHGQD